jgi:hypothetical protein
MPDESGYGTNPLLVVVPQRSGTVSKAGGISSGAGIILTLIEVCGFLILKMGRGESKTTIAAFKDRIAEGFKMEFMIYSTAGNAGLSRAYQGVSSRYLFRIRRG